MIPRGLARGTGFEIPKFRGGTVRNSPKTVRVRVYRQTHVWPPLRARVLLSGTFTRRNSTNIRTNAVRNVACLEPRPYSVRYYLRIVRNERSERRGFVRFRRAVGPELSFEFNNPVQLLLY